MAEDLAAEQSRLERQIALLETSLARAAAQLDVARRAGPRPRGLILGLVLGVALLVVLFFVVLVWTLAAISRMD